MNNMLIRFTQVSLATVVAVALPSCDSGDSRGDGGESQGSAGGGSGPGLEGSGSAEGGNEGAGEGGEAGDSSAGGSGDSSGGSDASGGGGGSSNDSDSNEAEADAEGSGGAEESKSDGGEDGEDSGDSDNGGGDDEEGGTGIRFDVEFPDGGSAPGGESSLEHSYIWIANSGESTVSKIDTRTLEEKGRYITRPDKAGNPSRTSVGLAGDVAVANRAGGITKIYADPEKCVDADGSGSVDTATDKTFLAWGSEECVAWYVAMPYGSQRGLAWAQGDINPETGEVTGEKLWVTGASSGDNNMHVLLLDGDDGSEVGSATVDLASAPSATAHPYGAYGGAVDPDRNFWFTNLGGGMIARVSYKDMSYQKWAKPHTSYGMTVDRKGRVWTCSSTIGRFTLATESWDTISGNFGSALVTSGASGGCMVDAKDRLWKSGSLAGGSQGVFAIDMESMAVLKAVALPAHSHGISIDFDGFVWGVSLGAEAYRVDPDAETFETFSDLVSAYTYSDMTGFALSAVSPVPVG